MAKAAQAGDEAAKQEIKHQYSAFFDNCSDEVGLREVREYLEGEFEVADEEFEQKGPEDDLKEAAEELAHRRVAEEEEAYPDDYSNSSETEESEYESDSYSPVVGDKKRKHSDSELPSNKRQDISYSDDDDNNNGKGGPGGFSGGGPGPGGDGGGSGEGPSASSSTKTMLNEEVKTTPTTNLSPIDFIIDLETTTCIYEDLNF